jgi:DNA-binding GntR family transcriptional regulator
MSLAAVLENVEPIRQRATNMQVYDRIRETIAGGGFKPGDTLSTRQFATALGVSQMPVREAFHRLVAEGALQNRPNRTIGLPMLSLVEFDEIAEVRALLEPRAAGKAALAIGRGEQKELERLSRAMEALPPGRDDSGAYLRLNREFHFTAYRASRSTELTKLIEQLWLRVGPFLNWISTPTDSRARSNGHHRALIGACLRRDADAAVRAITDDIMDGAAVVRLRFDEVSLQPS